MTFRVRNIPEMLWGCQFDSVDRMLRLLRWAIVARATIIICTQMDAYVCYQSVCLHPTRNPSIVGYYSRWLLDPFVPAEGMLIVVRKPPVVRTRCMSPGELYDALWCTTWHVYLNSGRPANSGEYCERWVQRMHRRICGEPTRAEGQKTNELEQ